MINLIVGKKGSGKTKKLVEYANGLISRSTGNVVVIVKGSKLTFELDHKARLVNADNYEIRDFSALYGFICGLCAGNYDLTDILVDSTLDIGGGRVDDFNAFIEKLNLLLENSSTKLTLSVSLEENQLNSAVKSISNIWVSQTRT